VALVVVGLALTVILHQLAGQVNLELMDVAAEAAVLVTAQIGQAVTEAVE
jgi:hypothetical protein